MKLGKASVAGVSLSLLAIQLAIVSTVAAKYLYQRWTCPRVWARSTAYDPEAVLRGRYLSVQLTVDGCQSTLPSAEQAGMPRDKNGVPTGTKFYIQGGQMVEFPARLKVERGKLTAIRIPESDSQSGGQMVTATPGADCADMRLAKPVDFYIGEHAVDPTPARRGQELWVEVTVPPKGPPRPLQLALKENGAWTPLAFQ
ncbi:MAG: hypothetical protein ACLPY1_24830 [Terracidiphilus sp.]